MRTIQALHALAALHGGDAAAVAQSDAPEIRFDSVPNAAATPGEHLSRRSGRRGDEFARRHFRLHTHGPSDHHDRDLASVRPRRFAAVRVRPHGKVRREIGKDSYGFMVRRHRSGLIRRQHLGGG